MNWDVRIKKVMNGYVAEWWEDGEDNSYVENQMVFEEPEGERGELEAFVSMASFLQAHFGGGGSKHDHYRIKCEVVDQRGAEQGEANCE